MVIERNGIFSNCLERPAVFTAQFRKKNIAFLFSLASVLLAGNLIPATATRAQPILGDSLELDSTYPFTRIRDVGTSLPLFYELSPTETHLDLHTNETRTTPLMFAPFRMRYDAQPGLMELSNHGVTIGAVETTFFGPPLHVLSNGPGVNNSVDHAKILVEDRNPATEPRTLIEMINRGGARCVFTNSVTGNSWAFQTNNSDGFLFNLLGSGGNEMSIRPTGIVTMGPGGVQNFFLDPVGNLTILGTLNPSSSRDMKEDFRPVNENGILNRIAQLPIQTWRYKRDTEPTRHIGPVSEDFYYTFRVGENDRTISVTDASGVALAGIKALKKQLDEKHQRITELESQITSLADRLARLESRPGR